MTKEQDFFIYSLVFFLSCPGEIFMPTYLCFKVSQSGDRTCIIRLDLKCVLLIYTKAVSSQIILRVFVPRGLATPAAFKSFHLYL